MSDDYVRDALGWIDDFRAPPGECGSPLARKLQIHALLLQGMTYQELAKMKYPFNMVKEVSESMLADAYKDGVK